MITGSLCLTQINEAAKSGHSAFSRASNGKIYFNIIEWENDNVDKFGNNFSVKLNPKKDAPDNEKNIYIGNLKRQERGDGAALDVSKDTDILDERSLPF